MKKNPKALDSYGRKPSGIERGNLIWAGDYDECIGISEVNWSGKYCYYEKYNKQNKFIFVNKFNKNQRLRRDTFG